MNTYRWYKLTKDICQMDHPADHGYILLTEYPKHTVVEFHLQGLPPGLHGCHIHESADKRNGCVSLGPHYNHHKGTHLDLNKTNNHLGDLGNILIDMNGNCNSTIIVNDLPLTGSCRDSNQVIGRSIVIHEKVDDLGMGNNKESKENGNSGNRICCGIIGFL